MRFFPPVVTGTVMLVIGLSLMRVGVNWAAGGQPMIRGPEGMIPNPAYGAPFALADKASPRFHEGIIRLNLIAPLNVAQQANALMQQQAEGGVIIFIGSLRGRSQQCKD